MTVEHTYGITSGESADDCFVLGYRGPAGEGFSSTRGDSWVVRIENTRFVTRMNIAGWLTGLWCSPGGRVFTTHASGRIFQTFAPEGSTWSESPVRGMPVGVWGLDEAHVYVWGLRGSDPFLLGWDGSSWVDMPAPPGRRIVAMGGLRPDLLVAVGESGLLARWDGRAWVEAPEAGREALTSVHVVSEDEMWACGGQGGVYQGSVYGWTKVADAGAPLSSVAKWGSVVWVAALGEDGLMKLDGTKLVSVKPNLVGLHLVPRAVLLFSSTELVGDTADGASFSVYGIETFVDITSPFPTPW